VRVDAQALGPERVVRGQQALSDCGIMDDFSDPLPNEAGERVVCGLAHDGVGDTEEQLDTAGLPGCVVATLTLIGCELQGRGQLRVWHERGSAFPQGPPELRI